MDSCNDSTVDTESSTSETKEMEYDGDTTLIEINDQSQEVTVASDNDKTWQPSQLLETPTTSGVQTRSTSKANSQKSVSSLNLLNFALFVDPITVEDALGGKESIQWREAMAEEMNSMKENNTWTLVDLPPNKKTTKSKWVFKRKTDDTGKVIRYKARLVAKGYSQIYGIDYEETYSPVVRYTSIRFLVALAAKKGLRIHQMDVVTAFLQGNLDVDIYMDQPDGFSDGTGKVCKLNRAIYGLKQAGRMWNIKLDDALKKFGLEKSKCDPCVYFKKDLQLIIAIYVDDFLIFHKGGKELEEVKHYLNKAFRMKDLGVARHCIGIRISQCDKYIELDQTNYITEVLCRFGMENSKPVGTPTETSQRLSAKDITDENSVVGKVPYQELVGCLLFLSQATRPDIAFSVNNVSRFNNNHTNTHWQAVKRILRYLSGTKEMKLRYDRNRNNQCELIAFSDADWGSDADERRSCSGYLIKLGTGAVSWGSKRQSIVALSSTEAEYIALSTTVKEVIWLRQLLSEIVGNRTQPTQIKCDNQSAIKLAQSDGYRPRSKHIDIRHHHIREKIADGTIIVEFVPTNIMVADSLTKAVTKEKHNFCNIESGLVQ